MADTSASGADDSNIVQVQVLLSAPIFLTIKYYTLAEYRDVAQFGSIFSTAACGGLKEEKMAQRSKFCDSRSKKFRAPQV